MLTKRERDESPDDQGTNCSALMACRRSKVPRCVEQTVDINKVRSTTMDYLNQLPEDLLLSIFSHLPLRKIVQTSIISHHLKNAASSISRLNFDLCNLFTTEQNLVLPKVKETKRCCEEYKDKFINGVNQFLKFHQGENLVAFTLSYCLRLDDKEDIDRWIRFAIKKNVMSLKLAFYCRGCWARSTNRYVVRTELFEGLSTKLNLLELAHCELRPTFLVHFHGLAELSLLDVLLDRHDLQNFFLCLPQLMKLKLVSCVLPGKLSLSVFPLLRVLFIKWCPGVHDVEFCNTALSNSHFWVRQPIRCNINGAPNLNAIGHSTRGDELSYLFTSLSKDFPSLKHLFVYTVSDWRRYIPERIHTFKRLKILKLSFRNDSRFDLLKVISILRASPVLDRFQLLTNCPKDVQRGKLELQEHMHRYLTTVEIASPLYTPSQLELISYLLKYAAALKSLSIWKGELNKNYWFKPALWGDGERESVGQLLKDCGYAMELDGCTSGNPKISLLPTPEDM